MSVTLERTKELLDKLKESISEVQSTEDFKRMLAAMSRFHKYSWRNCLLIYMQCHQATRVAGFHTWNKLNRSVKKGERAIWIFAPMTFKRKSEDEDSDAEIVTHFRVVPVFDLSQTEGEPLPTLEKNPILNTHEELLQKLQTLCSKFKIEIQFEDIAGLDGVSKIGSVVINSTKNPTEQSIILLHEIAHERIHDTKQKRIELTKEQCELEAEAVAWLVSQQLGLPETNSDKYLALYQKSYDLEKSLSVIHSTSQEILDHLNPENKGKNGSSPNI